MQKQAKLIIGVDGGGTHTRVIVARTDGTVLASALGGGASLAHDDNPARNVRAAIRDALDRAQARPVQVGALVAGIAGYDSPRDLRWVRELTRIRGLRCVPHHVNDAVIAHRGAFVRGAGIIVIAGTGSITVGITRSGLQVRNFDFSHYANSSARVLGGQAVFEILAGAAGATDAQFSERILEHLHMGSVERLRRRAAAWIKLNRNDRTRMFGELAPIVTACAMSGSELARRICDRAIDEMIVGVRLIRPMMVRPPARVPVALIGGVATSEYFTRRVRRELERDGEYALTPPAFPAAVGAVLIALDRLGRKSNASVLANLRSSTAYAAVPTRGFGSPP